MVVALTQLLLAGFKKKSNNLRNFGTLALRHITMEFPGADSLFATYRALL